VDCHGSSSLTSQLLVLSDKGLEYPHTAHSLCFDANHALQMKFAALLFADSYTHDRPKCF
jgi:hypothetical protein